MNQESKTISSKRIYSIDTVKVFAILAVIIVHVNPKYYSHPQSFDGILGVWYDFLRLLIGIAVFYFFMASGFLYGKVLFRGRSLDTACWKMCRRLLLIFVAWSLLYLFYYNVQWSLSWFMSKQIGIPFRQYFEIIHLNPIKAIFTGTAGHLWFVSALLFSIVILSGFIYWGQTKCLLYSSFIGYVFVSWFALYSPMDNLGGGYHFIPLMGPLIALPFVVSGYALSQVQKPSIMWAVMTIIPAIILYVFQWEYKWLSLVYGISKTYGSIGAFLFTYGIFILILRFPNFGKRAKIYKLAPYTLGIYCGHIMVLEKLKIVYKTGESGISDMILPGLTYIVSLFLVWILMKIPVVRKLVT